MKATRSSPSTAKSAAASSQPARSSADRLRQGRCTPASVDASRSSAPTGPPRTGRATPACRRGAAPGAARRTDRRGRAAGAARAAARCRPPRWCAPAARRAGPQPGRPPGSGIGIDAQPTAGGQLVGQRTGPATHVEHPPASSSGPATQARGSAAGPVGGTAEHGPVARASGQCDSPRSRFRRYRGRRA